MEASSIKQLLTGFCDGTHWKYAVFWKLNHRLPMTLSWEDGYYSFQKTKEVAESLSGDMDLKFPDEVYFSRGKSADDSEDYSARLLISEMSHHKYSYGEGVVGKIARTGDHCWVFCEDFLSSKFDSTLIQECPDEWFLQFASGIKTIVLISVLPQGVLQFGSFETAAEDMEFVINIKEKFHSFHLLAENTASFRDNYQDWLFSASTDTLSDIWDKSSTVTNSILKCDVSGSIALDANASTRLDPTMSTFDPRHVDQVETNDHMEEEEIWASSPWVNNVGLFGDVSTGLGSEQQFEITETGYDDVKNLNDFFTFPSESELHKALGSTACMQVGKSMLKYISAEEDTFSSSTLISNKEEHDHIRSLELPEGVDPEYLLDALVGNLFSATDDTSSISNSVRSPVRKPVVFTSSIHPKINSEESSLMMRSSDVKSELKPTDKVKDGNDCTDQITSQSFDGNSNLLVEEEWQEKVYSHSQHTNGPKISSSSKKRARPGTTQRSRPRDRQLIMDRMKELRELVPDGGRCSIDNLLERTIKHMLYLRKITSQGEKLKRFAHPEVPKCKKQKINCSHPGRSCAFDLESEQALPIVIEDIECSGHMLIEMVCSEHGLFLEIAQVIRKLELTILKGVLENRSCTAWARFIVEVPRGFHRMDVLCPLLHLLQLRRNPVSYKCHPFQICQ